MSKQKRRSFSAQFKSDAAALVTKGGKTVSAVGKMLGVSIGSLRLWIKQSETVATGSLSLDERTELMMLRKRLKRVEMERDILKKATAYFARESA